LEERRERPDEKKEMKKTDHGAARRNEKQENY
jgi:hypothetical protein